MPECPRLEAFKVIKVGYCFIVVYVFILSLYRNGIVGGIAGRNLGTASDPDLTSGEKFLTEFLSTYFLSGCQSKFKQSVSIMSYKICKLLSVCQCKCSLCHYW